jgi:exopolysaccharide biosynthesis WecB/TagA/CpsF family protein
MSRELLPPPLAHVGGQAINLADGEDALARVGAYLQAGEGFTFATLNLDHLVKLRQNPAFRAAYARTTLVTADGAPVAAMARETAPQVRRTTGADLFQPLCAVAARAGAPIALFGSSQDSLEQAAAELRAKIDGLAVVHVEAPSQGFDPCSAEADAAGARIAASGARLVFVCLGAPKQEIFADRMARRHPGLGFVGVGASADFVAGAQKRAPLLAQKMGLEWFWRMATNPRRLAWRYLQCAVLLAQLKLERALAGAPAQPLHTPGE